MSEPVNVHTLFNSVKGLFYQTNKTLSREKQDRLLSNYRISVDRELTSSAFIPLTIFFSLVIVVSLIGNSLVCLVIYRKRSLRTVVNIFLLNLSIIQILICVLIIPANLIKFVHRSRWVLGTSMCYVVFFVQCLTMYQSSFILISVALDRYRVIVVPLGKRISRRTAFMMLAVSWFTASLIASLQTLAVRTDSLDIVASAMDPNTSAKTCSLEYPEHLASYLYALIFFTQYCIPVIVMITLYSRIVVVLRSCVEYGASFSGRIRNRSKKKVVTMLIVVVVLFFISWAPIHIYLILTSVLAKYSISVYYACYWFAMSNVWYNPIIYCWLNIRYRRAVRLVLQGCFHCKFSLRSSSSIPKAAYEPPGVQTRKAFDGCRCHDLGTYKNRKLDLRRNSGTPHDSQPKSQISIEMNDLLGRRPTQDQSCSSEEFVQHYSLIYTIPRRPVTEKPTKSFVSLP